MPTHRKRSELEPSAQPTPPNGAAPSSRRALLGLSLGITTLALVAVGLVAAGQVSDRTAEPMHTPEAAGGFVIEVPGGLASAQPLPAPIARPTNSATPAITATPTPQATDAATAAPTVAPTLTPTSAPVTMAGTPTVPPSPTTDTAAGPAEAVLTFYQAVADADFDAAYALWDERMRTTYPRDPNLDSRFDRTAAITFSQLSVAEVSGETATVQANFTETYESGSSRQFIGYWRVVQVDGRWLLDEPHY